MMAADAREGMEALAMALERYDAGRVWPAVVEIFHAGEAENFANEQSAAGVRWPPRKDNKPHPLLRLSLAMMTAATSLGGGGFMRSTATTATVGIDLGAVPYARAQNFGHAYSVGGRSWYLPPREYFFASPETIRRMSDRLAADVREYLLEAVR